MFFCAPFLTETDNCAVFSDDVSLNYTHEICMIRKETGTKPNRIHCVPGQSLQIRIAVRRTAFFVWLHRALIPENPVHIAVFDSELFCFVHII